MLRTLDVVMNKNKELFDHSTATIRRFANQVLEKEKIKNAIILRAQRNALVADEEIQRFSEDLLRVAQKANEKRKKKLLENMQKGDVTLTKQNAETMKVLETLLESQKKQLHKLLKEQESSEKISKTLSNNMDLLQKEGQIASEKPDERVLKQLEEAKKALANH